MAACVGALTVREVALCVIGGHFFAVTRRDPLGLSWRFVCVARLKSVSRVKGRSLHVCTDCSRQAGVPLYDLPGYHPTDTHRHTQTHTHSTAQSHTSTTNPALSRLLIRAKYRVLIYPSLTSQLSAKHGRGVPPTPMPVAAMRSSATKALRERAPLRLSYRWPICRMPRRCLRFQRPSPVSPDSPCYAAPL